ncbi:unnamed protein product [Nesidiocoris tenuis]|uniref:PHD-type domain-containing protein n=1 Tax=Nesidiocoris tenuis TaxID=355587 RepID=A0A6H5GS23_9HEMI|nr:unnamed protein product [Nesidiocoris tenuis]
MATCSKCADTVLLEDQMACATCDRIFHFACAGMIEANFRKLSKINKTNWKCPVCKNSVQPHAAVEDRLEALFANMKKDMKEDSLSLRKELKEEAESTRRDFGALIAGLSSKIDNCLEKYDVLSAQVVSLKGDMDSRFKNLEKRIADLESSDRASVAPAPRGRDLEMVAAELEERRRRASNIIVYDFPESTLTNSMAILADDLCRVKQSLDQLRPHFSGLVQRISRIGRASASGGEKPRPIMVVFDSPATATNVLVANRSSQPPVLSAASDRTHAQRDYLRSLREELRRINEEGKTNHTIKYIGGVPSIVPSTEVSRDAPGFSKNGGPLPR